jgi:hypothetical protein
MAFVQLGQRSVLHAPVKQGSLPDWRGRGNWLAKVVGYILNGDWFSNAAFN